jgi:hypothetical protein
MRCVLFFFFFFFSLSLAVLYLHVEFLFSSGAYPHPANLDLHCVVASRHIACSPTRHAAWVQSSPTTVALGPGRVWIEYASSPSAPSATLSVRKVTGPKLRGH